MAAAYGHHPPEHLQILQKRLLRRFSVGDSEPTTFRRLLYKPKPIRLR